MESNFLKIPILVLLFAVHSSANSQAVSRYCVSSFQISGVNDSVFVCAGQSSAGFNNFPESYIGYLPLDYSLLSVAENENSFNVYPIPAAEKIYIQSNQLLSDFDVVHLIDISGRLIKSFNLNESMINHFGFDISDILPGSYLITIQNGSEVVYNKKIIII